MGTKREVLGYIVVVKPYRKLGNGAVGGGRKGSSGKKCFLYKVGADGRRDPVVSSEGPNAKDAVRELRKKTDVIPSYVAINHRGETSF